MRSRLPHLSWRTERRRPVRILLVHRLNLGDLVCASPAIQWLKSRHPDARFRLVTNDFAARVGALIPELEEVYAYRKFGRMADREWRQILRARRWRADRVIGLSPTPDRKLAWRMRMLGTGGSADPGARAADFGAQPSMHATERLAFLFGWRGGELLPPARLRPPQLQGSARDVAIWISARKPSNQPSPEQVLGIVRELQSRGRASLSIGVFGLPERTNSGAHLPDADAQSRLAGLLEAAGLRLETPPLEVLLAELASSSSLIAPDGGMAHVAAGFGKPVVALFGDVRPQEWRPWSPRAKVLQSASRKVTDIEAGAVADAWEEAIASPA